MIIFLNGNSSSGKSEIARAIMHQSDRPFLYYSIDHLVNFWIDEKFVAFENEPKAWFFQQNVKDILESPAPGVQGPHVDQLRWDMIESISVLIKKGYDFIIDDVLWKEEIFQHYASALCYGKTIYLIKIFCELLESERREKLRPDRYQGIARTLYERVYLEPPGYDFEIETSYVPVEACAAKILEYVNKHPSPKAFLTYLQDEIHFKPLTEEYFSLLQEWLNTPQVNQWWGEAKFWNFEAVEKKYQSYLLGYKEVHGQQKSIRGFVICCADSPIGYIQVYNAHDFLEAPVENLPPSLGGLDLFIADPGYLSKGLGVASIIKFLDQVVWQKFDNCLVSPAVVNQTAIEAYLQAGFKLLKQLSMPEVVLMVKGKPL